MHNRHVLRRHQAFLPILALLVLLGAERGNGCVSMETDAQAYAASLNPDTRLQTLLDAAVRDGLVGASLRVKGPGVDFQGAAGVANLMTGEPLSTNHVIYTASLGKTFTSTVALQLYQEGRLDLDAPITRWLPNHVTKRIPSSGKITLRHLLNHSSGLIDYMNDDKAWRTDFVMDPYRQWAHGEVVAYLYDQPLLFEPGKGYHYSNSNYVIAGLVIEQVVGQPLHTLIRKRILAPLGLLHTYNGHESVGEENRAHGYINRYGRVIDTSPWYSHYGLADSGIHSTPADLAVFIESLFNSEEILSEAMKREMTRTSASGHPPSDYGMGIYVQRNPWGAGRCYSHDGIDPGYQADIIYHPDLDLTIVLAANASLGEANYIYQKLITAVVQVALDAVRK